MERRGFLKLFTGGIAGIALDQAIPFNRVWSFPKKIIIGNPFDFTPNYLRAMKQSGRITGIPQGALEIGDIVTIAQWPQRFVITDVITNAEESIVNLYAPEGNLIYRGAKANQLRPLLCGQFIASDSQSLP